jgi:hypothetical protein
MNADSVRAALSAALLTDAEFALPIEEWWTTFENPFQHLLPEDDDDEDDDNDEGNDSESDGEDDGDLPELEEADADDAAEKGDDSAGEEKPDGDAGDEEEGGGDEGTLYRTVFRVIRKPAGVNDASHNDNC